MKNRFNLLTVMLASAAMLTACNTLEVTLPKGPQGEQGIQGVSGKDGLSAYETWVKCVNDNTISDWDGGTDLNDFFRYLKGKDGHDGKNGLDGKDGKDGKDGQNGKSALELWREYVAAGVDDPKNPGTQWDKERTSERDFYIFLSGADGVNGKDGKNGKDGRDGADGQDGKDGEDGMDGLNGQDGQDGLSAYELWVLDVTSEEGLANPGNGVYDLDEFPLWPRDAVSVEDFYHYLTGRNGKDGKDGENAGTDVPVADILYSERVDGQRYNVAPVIALSKTKDGSMTYEYVNPFSGGAAFIVTGPGPVIIPDCEVTFTTMDGNRTYTKTSDASGYVYLTRSELPEWYEGAPSAADDSTDLSSGIRPSSFAFDGKTVTDASKIASTCKVPYRVGLDLQLVEGALRGRYSLVRYEIHRIVEGVTEEDCFIVSSPRGLVNDYRGFGYLHTVPAPYRYYRNEGAVKRLRDMYGSASSVSSDLPDPSSADGSLLDFFCTVANLTEGELPGCQRKVGSESFVSPSFGDGAAPSVIDVNSTFASISKGRMILQKYKPDYGLVVSDGRRSIHVPSITQLPSTLENTSYIWKSGHTTLSFELDWDAIEKLEVADGYGKHWEGDRFVFDYVPFNKITGRPTSTFSSFRAKGKFNGSAIDSKVTVEWGRPVVFTDIYDAFSVSIADVESGFIMFDGIGSSFTYDASEDDENGNGKAYMFGQEIVKSEDRSE